MATHQNELYIQVACADGLISPISKIVQTFKSWIYAYDSSSLVSLWPVHEDDSGTKWWLLCVPGAICPPSYHFSRFSSLIMFSLQIPKNLMTSFHSQVNLAWIYNLTFDALWWPLEAPLGCMSFNCSINAITGKFATACCKKHPFSTNTKINLMGSQIHKVLVNFVLSSTTVRKLN